MFLFTQTLDVMPLDVMLRIAQYKSGSYESEF